MTQQNREELVISTFRTAVGYLRSTLLEWRHVPYMKSHRPKKPKTVRDPQNKGQESFRNQTNVVDCQTSLFPPPFPPSPPPSNAPPAFNPPELRAFRREIKLTGAASQDIRRCSKHSINLPRGEESGSPHNYTVRVLHDEALLCIFGSDTECPPFRTMADRLDHRAWLEMDVSPTIGISSETLLPSCAMPSGVETCAHPLQGAATSAARVPT